MTVILADSLEAALDTARGVTLSQKALVKQYVDKYLSFFDTTFLPTVEVQDNVDPGWLGRTLWRTSKPKTSIIVLQKSILSDPKTLERVIAHEVIHHVDFVTLSAGEVEAMRLGAKRDGHGPKFLDLASRVNSEVGDDFVTVKSDETYAVASTKTFYILIIRGDLFNKPDKYLYAWSAGLPKKDKSQRWLQNVLSKGGRLFKTSHRDFVRGAKFGSGQWTLPDDEQEQKMLKAIYDKGV